MTAKVLAVILFLFVTAYLWWFLFHVENMGLY